MSELPLQWIITLIAAYVAMRCLISLANRLREHLQGLLVAHVKRQQVESLKRRRIEELRAKIRKKKADAASQEKRAA
jgi:hypothetical protein